MGLAEQAAKDLQTILNDKDGFARDITIQNPDGVCDSIRGFWTDIAETIDPNTGQAVSGRLVSVALAMRDLQTLDCYKDFGLPDGRADTSTKPWLVTFVDVVGVEHTFKVQESNPDRALGSITCTLEVWSEG